LFGKLYEMLFILVTILLCAQVFGLMTKPLISILLPHPKYQSRSLSFSSDAATPKSVTVPLLGEGQDSLDDLGGHDIPRPSSLRALLTTPTHTVHYYWRKFDNAFMRPMFGGRGFVPYVPGSPTERNPPQNQWHWKESQARCTKYLLVVSIVRIMKPCYIFEPTAEDFDRILAFLFGKQCIIFCN